MEPRMNISLRISDDSIDKCKKNAAREDLRRERVFKSRSSVIAQLLENEHSQKITNAMGVYNIVLVGMMYSMMGFILWDYVEYGKFTFGMGIVSDAFANFHWALLIWFCMLLHIFLCFVCFVHWSQRNKALNEQGKRAKLKLWNTFWIFIWILFYVEFLCFPIFFIFVVDFGVASKYALFMEQIRMLMKIHGYIRYKSTAEPDNCRTFNEEFHSFSYYLFAPTLIYRDSYPRSKKTNYRKVAVYVAEFLFIFYFWCLVFEKLFKERYQTYGTEYVPWSNIIYWCLLSAPVCYLLIITGFYIFFEAWMNFCAELLKYDDRCFYKNWWSATGVSMYLRDWNYIVYEWLYEYVYLDFSYKFLPPILARFTVIFISAFFHEYIISLAVGSGLLVTYLSFLSSGILANIQVKQLPRPFANLLFHCSSMFGVVLIPNLHYMEYFARRNCPTESDNPIVDFFIPRYLVCNINNSYRLS